VSTAESTARTEGIAEPRPRVAVVTGATRGIGLACAKALAARGFRIVGTGRDRDALAALERDVPGAVGRALDMGDCNAMPAFAAEVEADVGPVAALVNNAGFGLRASVEEAPIDKVRQSFEVNVVGLLALTQAILPAMRARRAGRIVMVSSVQGRVAVPFSGIYTATKFALEGMSDALRMELRPFGIQVAQICPGPVRTDFAATAKDLSTDVLHADASPYAGGYRAYLAKVSKVNSSAVSAESVAARVVHAVTARRARPRYPAHWIGRVLPRLRAILPTAWLDWILAHKMWREYGPPPAPRK
jgi:short-subunit dehydrogenase